jgi:glycosyl transferase, family 25
MKNMYLNVDRVFYINLDSRTDRKLRVQRELLKLFRFDQIERFPAVKVSGHGALGCAKSHLEVLKLAMARGYKNYIVVEDDIEILNLEELSTGIKEYNTSIDGRVSHDILLLAANTFQFQRTQFKSIIRTTEAFAAMAYMVRSHYYPTLLKTFEESVHLLEKHGRGSDHLFALDVCWKQLQARDTWLQLYPVTITQRPDYSDIVGGNVDYTESILTINKM